MPVVSCPYCTNPVSLPTPWTAPAYTCPHCQRTVATSSAPSYQQPQIQPQVQTFSPPPPPPPPPVPMLPPPPTRSYEDEFNDDPRPRNRRQGSPFMEFATFRLMIAPVIIQVVFWIGVASCVLGGGSTIIGSFSVPAPYESRNVDRDYDDDVNPKTGAKTKAKQSPPTRFSPLQFFTGLLMATVGPLLIRLACEFYILLFKIHDELKLTNDREKYRT